jgi:hypothetical protein
MEFVTAVIKPFKRRYWKRNAIGVQGIASPGEGLRPAKNRVATVAPVCRRPAQGQDRGRHQRRPAQQAIKPSKSANTGKIGTARSSPFALEQAIRIGRRDRAASPEKARLHEETPDVDPCTHIRADHASWLDKTGQTAATEPPRQLPRPLSRPPHQRRKGDTAWMLTAVLMI